MKHLFSSFILFASMGLKAQNISYIPFYTETTYNAKVHDQSLAVGATAGSPSVNNGAATYSIPIVDVSRPEGAMPSATISVSYNSMAQDGLLGRGWNLEGITSIISRSQKTKANHGETSPSCTEVDAFTLDGKTLIKDDAASTARVQIWHPEIEDFSLIKSFSNTNGQIEKWEITTKDGIKMTYGSVATSRIFVFNQSGINTSCNSSAGDYILWYLDKVTFLSGRERLYTYSGSFYTETKAIATISDDYSITKFNYKIRTDKNIAYMNGYGANSINLLDNIEVIANNTSPNELVRKYELRYSTDNINSYLSEVQEVASDGTKINPTIFKYGDRDETNLKITKSANFEISKTLIVSQNNTVLTQPSSTTYSYIEIEGINVTGDFNGDGFTDLVKFYECKANTFCLSKYLLTVLINNKDNTYSHKNQYRNGDLLNFFVNKNPYKTINTSDYNGDGIDDIVTTEMTGFRSRLPNNNPSNTTVKVNIYTFDKDGKPTLKLVDPVTIKGYADTVNSQFSPPAYWNNYPNFGSKYFHSGDFDGDGNLDYLLILSNNGGKQNVTKAFISYPSRDIYNQPYDMMSSAGTNQFWPQVVSSSISKDISQADKVYVIDYDGDGKSEIMIKNKVIIFNSNNFTVNNGNNIVYNSNELIYPGDFNGDKKTDFLVKAANSWEVWFSYGIKFENKYSFSLSEIPNFNSSDCNKSILISDYNGDGKSDILLINNITASCTNSPLPAFTKNCNSHNFTIFYSKGDGFFTKSQPSSFNFTSGDDICKSILVGDFNGDGKADLNIVNRGSATPSSYIIKKFIALIETPFPACSCSYSINKRTHLFFDEASNEQLLTKVKTGFGVKSEFKYETLSRMGSNHQETYNNEKSYPSSGEINYYSKIPIKVVTQMIGDQNQGVHIISYSYKGALINKAGRGFLGFREVIAVDETYDRTTISYTNSNPDNLIPSHPWLLTQDKSETYRTSDYLLLNRSETYYQSWPRPYSLYQYAYKVVSYDYFSGTSTTDIDYDSYSNIYQSTNTSPLGRQKLTEYDYGATVSQRPALPISKTETSIRAGKQSISYKTNFTYTSEYQIDTKTDFVGLPNTIVTDYDYNWLGLMTKTTVTPAGMTSRSTENIYDPANEKFLVKTKNILGQETQVNINKKWNEPEEIISPEGIVTNFEFDVWGRKTRTTDASGNASATLVNWDSQLTNNDGLAPIYVVTKTQTKAPSSHAFVDKLGKTFLDLQYTPDNKYLHTYIYYDKSGNNTVTYKTDHFNNFLALTQVSYDAFNRPTHNYVTETSSSSPLILMSSMEYANVNGNWVTTAKIPASISNPAGRVSTVTKNLDGEKIESNDNGKNTLTYEYDAQGKPTKVKNGAMVLTETTYDAYGRKSQIKDNSQGTYTFEYYSSGELKKQTTPSGFTQVTYDAFGRVDKEIINEGTKTYTYYPINDPSPAKACKLKKITGPITGNYEEYDYDTKGRMYKLTKGITGIRSNKAFVTQLAFNNQNQVITKISPSNNVYTYIYNNLGALNQIKKGTTNIYEVVQYHPSGNIKDYKLGNKIVSNTYNHFHQLNGTFSSGIINDEYVWDPINGNMTNRNEHHFGFLYNYEYDAFDQLTREELIPNRGRPAMINDLYYKDNGNIESKSSAGDYQYKINTTKEFAVQKIVHAEGFSPYPQDIQYTSYDRPFQLKQHIHQLNYEYDHSYQRVKAIYKKNNQEQYTRYYAGDFEEMIIPLQINRTQIDYIYAGSQLVAIDVNLNGNVHLGGNPSTLWSVFTDYQGTIRAVDDGTTTIHQAYDAWGVPRDLTTGTLIHHQAPSQVPSWLYRGYTGQEHLYEFDLINLNARLYDPHNSRMLGPDINLGGDNLLGYNRYTYCINNPLKFIDPSGNIVIPAVVVAMMVGAGLAGASYIISEVIMNQGNFTFEGLFVSMSIGAVSGMFTFGIGEALLPMAKGFGKELLRATMHSLVQSTAAAGQGADFGKSFVSNFATSLISHGYADKIDVGAWANSTIDNYVFNSIIGGATAGLAGGDIIKGMASSLMMTSLNQLGGNLIKKAQVSEAKGQGVRDRKKLFDRTYKHYQTGKGKDLKISTEDIDLSGISKKDLSYSNKTGKYSVDLFKIKGFSQTGLALGKVSFSQIDNNTFTIDPDLYDFNIEFQDLISKRNFATFGALLLHNPTPVQWFNSTPFYIKFNGTVQFK